MTFEKISQNFRDFVDSCGKLNYFTRSKELQSQKVQECEEFILQIKSYKSQAVHFDSEPMANEFFHMQCVVNALKSVLNMWLALKDESYQKSWSYLIDAQEYTCIGLKVKEYEGILNFQQQLIDIESAVFPSWALYNSSGAIESIGNCSICTENFLHCEHIENEIYFGSLCQRIDRKILEVDHVAVVETPRDKRCIITKTSDDDRNMIDYFTLLKTGENKNKEEGVIGYMEGVVFAIPMLDVN
jgi:hypothetical protein